MNCKCGSLIVPNGSNCLLTLVDTDGQEVSTSMNHSVNAMVNDGRKLITYADIPPVSFNDQLRQVIVSFTDGRERIIEGKFRVYITYNDNIIASQYIGVKNDIYIIPNNKITMSCSNILDTISDDSRIFVMFESICDNSQDECCEDDNIDFELEDAIEFLCTVERETTTTTPEPLGYVLTDCDRGCESAPLSESEFASFQLCAEQYQLLCTGPAPRTTTTTPDPNADPDRTTTTTTAGPTTTAAPTTTTTEAPVVTTTAAPSADAYTVVMDSSTGIGAEIAGGCYNRIGSILNGKYQYRWIEIDGNFGDYCNKDIIFTGGQWRIYLSCDNDAPSIMASAPDNGSLEPPLTGWTNNITLTPNCID